MRYGVYLFGSIYFNTFDNFKFLTTRSTRSIRTSVRSIRDYVRMSVLLSGVSELLSGVSMRKFGCPNFSRHSGHIPGVPGNSPLVPGEFTTRYQRNFYGTGYTLHPVPNELLRYRVVFPPGTIRYHFIFVLFSFSFLVLL